jgi:hypothetical protein
MIASPITGLVRGLNALISGLAIQLGQIRDQGLVGGDAPAEEPARGGDPGCGGGSGRGCRGGGAGRGGDAGCGGGSAEDARRRIPRRRRTLG